MGSYCQLKVQLIPIFLSALLSYTRGSCFQFPKDFTFGVATSAYQIEGAWNVSGKGENKWDRITHQYPELIEDRSNGDIACDSYNLWSRDLQLLKNLNVHFYRFSISWSRLLPTGFSNKINPDGVRYYNDLINELLYNNIQPMVTIYHYDLPQPLQDLGGWPNPLLAKYYNDYANIVFKLFGDRVKTWITFNEPIEICKNWYGKEELMPPVSSNEMGKYLCAHTILIAHSSAYHLYDKYYKPTQRGKIGITIQSHWYEPKTNSQNDIEAAERAIQMNFGWLAHPIFSSSGDYPLIMKDRIAFLSKAENFSFSRLPQFSPFEVEYIRGTFDFLGLNHYLTYLVSDIYVPINGPVSNSKDESIKLENIPTRKKSAFNIIPNVPWGFRKLLNWIKKNFENPLVYVTENGFADFGDLNDIERIEYHKDYLNALLEAIYFDKCNVKAYTIWSLMDNFEWRRGYTLKFGLYHVNFTDPGRQRTPKASVKFYKNVIMSNAVSN